MGLGPVVEAMISSGRVDFADVQALPQEDGRPVEHQLVERGAVDVDEVLETLRQLYNVPAVLLAEEDVDPDCLGLVPRYLAENCRVLPLRRNDKNQVVLAMADPDDVVAEDFVRFVTGLDIERVAAMAYEVTLEIKRRYADEPSQPTAEMMPPVFTELEELALAKERAPDPAATVEMESPTDAAPVAKAIASLLAEAVTQKASDIHFEPVASGLRVRYRIDGHLREITELPRVVQPMVLSRLKLQSGMDISEKRRPQDGRTRLQVGDHDIDFRVSSLPTYYGEKVVLRILDSKKAAVEIEAMGWSERDLGAFLDFIRMPQGAILITGPTGSGKTSTLYAALARIHKPNINIVTVEDPIEFQISGINQVQVNNKAGLTFAAALRSILRQDPNVVMLGEIRDAETANIAFEAAMTGHLVLSTLHTNDAPSAVSRLIHIGVPDYMVAGSLVGIVAQRLVRRLCSHCRKPGPVPAAVRNILLRSGLLDVPQTSWFPSGCPHCSGIGYRGRMGIFEVLRVTESIKRCVYAGASEQEIKEIAVRESMQTLLLDGLWKAAEGMTTLEEVLSVAPAGTSEAGAQAPALPQFEHDEESNFSRVSVADLAATRTLPREVGRLWVPDGVEPPPELRGWRWTRRG